MAATATAPRLIPVPRIEPPYDDVVVRLIRRTAGQDPLPLMFGPRIGRLPLGAATSRGRKRTAASTEDRPAEPRTRWQRSSRAELCDPWPWATRLSRGIAEVLTGIRSARQLAPWFTEDTLCVLLGGARRQQRQPARNGASVRPGPRILVRSVHTCEPADGACEISIHLRVGDRGRAVAMRAEGRDGRWVCTALRIG